MRETRVIDYAAGGTWRNVRHGPDRMQLVRLATAEGQVAQRPASPADQKASPLKLPEPPRFFDFTIEVATAGLPPRARGSVCSSGCYHPRNRRQIPDLGQPIV